MDETALDFWNNYLLKIVSCHQTAVVRPKRREDEGGGTPANVPCEDNKRMVDGLQWHYEALPAVSAPANLDQLDLYFDMEKSALVAQIYHLQQSGDCYLYKEIRFLNSELIFIYYTWHGSIVVYWKCWFLILQYYMLYYCLCCDTSI
jgi:hypothetical protein